MHQSPPRGLHCCQRANSMITTVVCSSSAEVRSWSGSQVDAACCSCLIGSGSSRRLWPGVAGREQSPGEFGPVSVALQSGGRRGGRGLVVALSVHLLAWWGPERSTFGRGRWLAEERSLAAADAGRDLPDFTGVEVDFYRLVRDVAFKDVHDARAVAV